MSLNPLAMVLIMNAKYWVEVLVDGLYWTPSRACTIVNLASTKTAEETRERHVLQSIISFSPYASKFTTILKVKHEVTSEYLERNITHATTVACTTENKRKFEAKFSVLQ